MILPTLHAFSVQHTDLMTHHSRTTSTIPRLVLVISVCALLLALGVIGLIASTPTTLTLWDGPSQRFGHNGIPQEWVNVLGNVTDTDGLQSLTYSLNGGPLTNLSLGSDGTRLAQAGDFNVELRYADLLPGPNVIQLTATDLLNNQAVQQISLQYDSGYTWPLPYTADWSAVSAISQTAQIVDGRWLLEADSIRPAFPYYDRLVTLGDVTMWHNYEVVVPITVHSLDPNAPYGPPGGAPGAGVIVRWQGHNRRTVNQQPGIGWDRHGALGWFRWTNGNAGGKLLMKGNTIVTTDNTGSKQVAFSTTYYYKLRSVTVPGIQSYYHFRVWPAGQPEPLTWDLVGRGDNNSTENGSVLLVAHYVDASYGNVAVTPITDLTPDLFRQTVGSGSITVSADPTAGETGYTYDRNVTLTAVPDAGWLFRGWEGMLAGQPNPVALVLTEDITATARFDSDGVVYTLTTATAGQGTLTRSPEKNSYQPDEIVTLTAQANLGWAFSGWSGDLSGNTNPATITMTDNQVVTATFTQNQYTLTTTAAPLESGSITHTPDKPSYTYGEVVTLTAQPNTHWLFSGWSGDLSGNTNPITITMDGNQSITATFIPQEYPVTGIASPLEGGTVSRTPDAATYAAGTQITLTATPHPGWTFTGWTGDVTGTANPFTLLVDGSKSVTATFTVIEHTLTISAQGGTVTRAPDKAVYNHGEIVTLTAQPEPGRVFAGWNGDLSGNGNPTMLVMEGDRTVTASFVQEQYSLTVQAEGSGTADAIPSQAAYSLGEQVQLTAHPQAGWAFSGWRGRDGSLGTNNPLTLTISGNQVITATFITQQVTHSLTTAVDDGAGQPQGGSVTVNPAGPYSHGQVVTLTALPDAGWRFVRWRGDVPQGQTVTDATLTVAVTADITLVAEFVRVNEPENQQHLYLPIVMR